MPRTALPLPAPLARGAHRFAQWREKRSTRAIPAPLWSLATRLGVQHGVSLTSRVLSVPYHGLKRRVEAAGASFSRSLARTRKTAAPTTFVELLPSPTSPGPECLVGFENACGAKMRIQVTGESRPDLAALSRLFLEQRG